MSPSTGLDHECISTLAIYTSPSSPFSWGEIALLVSPSLADSELVSSTKVLVRSLLHSTPCFHLTLTYQAARTVHDPDTPSPTDSHSNLVHLHQWPYDNELSQTDSLQFLDPVITKYMKLPCSNLGSALAALRHHFNLTCDLCQCTDTSDTHKIVRRVAPSPWYLARITILQR